MMTFIRNRHGVATIEMALILPLFLFALMGFLECAHIFWIRSTMENALLSAARFAVVNAADDERIRQEFMANFFGARPGDVTFTITPSEEDGIHYQTLSATRTHNALLSFVPALSNMTLQTQITVPASADFLDCAQDLPVNKGSGGTLLTRNETPTPIHLLFMDSEGHKKTFASLKPQDESLSFNTPGIVIVASDDGACMENVVRWRTAPNLIVSAPSFPPLP